MGVVIMRGVTKHSTGHKANTRGERRGAEGREKGEGRRAERREQALTSGGTIM